MPPTDFAAQLVTVGPPSCTCKAPKNCPCELHVRIDRHCTTGGGVSSKKADGLFFKGACMSNLRAPVALTNKGFFFAGRPGFIEFAECSEPSESVTFIGKSCATAAAAHALSVLQHATSGPLGPDWSSSASEHDVSPSAEVEPVSVVSSSISLGGDHSPRKGQ